MILVRFLSCQKGKTSPCQNVLVRLKHMTSEAISRLRLTSYKLECKSRERTRLKANTPLLLLFRVQDAWAIVFSQFVVIAKPLSIVQSSTGTKSNTPEVPEPL
jgi:hypothetical protein